MEKFAIDLDKVLDDFEFNEDCAEQIAAINTPPNNSTSSEAKCVLEPSGSNTYNYHKLESEKSIQDFQILPSLEKRKNSKDYDTETRSLKEQDITAENVDYSKSDLMLGSTGSINNFYIHDTITDNKVMPKQNALPYSSEQAPLTIHNDITHKVLQKQQNGSTNPKIDNRYDKKLNQLNIKPSVSNVLNSLNEYINAPSGGLNYVHTVIDKTEDEPNIDSIIFQNINKNSTKDNFVKDYTVVKNIAKDSNESITQGQTSSTFNPVQESCASHHESIVVPATLSTVTAHISSMEDNNTTSSSSSRTSENEKQLSKHDTSAAINENAIQYEYEDVFVDVIILKSEPASSFNDTTADNKETNNDKQEKISHSPVNECIYSEDQQKQITTENKSELTAKELVFENTRIIDEIKLEVEGATVDTIYTDNSISARKVFGLSNIDDLSEEELTKYLTELEEEERLKDTGMPRDTFSSKSQEEISDVILQGVTETEKDQIVHNVSILESVVTAEVPSVSEGGIYMDAKQLPVNHYNQEKQDDKTANATFGMQNTKEYRSTSESNITEEQCQIKEEIHTSLNTVTDTLSSTRNMEFESSSDIDNGYSNKISGNCADSQEKDMSSFTSTSEFQEHCTYKLNAEHKSLNCIKADRQLKENEGAEENPPPYDQACELKMESTFDQISADNNTMSYENTILEHITNYSDDMTTSIETSAEINPNDSSDESDKPLRPQTLDIGVTDSADQPGVPAGSTNVAPSSPMQSDIDVKDDCQGSSPDLADNTLLESNSVLGKQPPFWVPDSDAPSCMLCDIKFTVLKRRHHCRACGKVLCSKCCNMKYKLEYQGNIDSRVCVHCYQLLTKAESEQGICDWNSGYSTYTSNNDINSPQGRQPNPNNPMEYCSTIPPLQQLAGGLPPPPTVMVPVGVLKREGGNKNRPEGSKSVMFSDGIRPGCDLTELDMSWDLKPLYRKPGSKRISTSGSSLPSTASKRQNLPRFDPNTSSYVPHDPNALPPTVTIYKGQVTYHAVTDGSLLYKTLKNECEPPVMFAINRNLYAYVKITNLNCCVNKICWNITSKGLACVGQDEVILLVETLPDETRIPKDLLIFINQLYIEAIKGNTVSELGFAVYQSGNLLGSREHAGFLFIRQTLQCLQKIVLPSAPFLVGLLVHRWETPWAKVFPLRLLLRLGAEYRYYPCPMVSVRFRDALYFEIGHTVMKVLADFRNFGYTLPGVRGLTIHLRNRMTDVMFPRNRYDQVIKGLNNSNDHVLAYASNFSISADSHLVCIQTNTGDESSYQTQAINIHNKPRTVTGASFIVINGALKSSMGLSAKSSIVEDGLMVEIMPEKMEALKAALKNMQDFSIGCGRQGASEPDETVNIKWVDNDVQFNLGVRSPIDGQLMDGIPSIRVHNGTDYKGTSRFIRWTEVFIMKSDDHPTGVHDPVDINKLSGNIAKATCTALVKLLDLLSTAGLTKLGVRTTIHPDNVGYEAGSEGTKLPPIYMNSLDNELIQVLHKAAQNSQDTHTVLELIFYILDD